MRLHPALAALMLGGCTERVPLVSMADGEAPRSIDASRDVLRAPDLVRSERFSDSATGDGVCREGFSEAVTFTNDAPELIISLDRSFSMFSTKLGATGRIQAVQQTFRTLLRNYHGAIRLGYEEFPMGR